jgi:hypothetical protein
MDKQWLNEKWIDEGTDTQLERRNDDNEWLNNAWMNETRNHDFRSQPCAQHCFFSTQHTLLCSLLWAYHNSAKTPSSTQIMKTGLGY